LCYGKAISELIDWQFSEEYEDARQEINEFGITEEEIRADKNDLHIKAYFPPVVVHTAYPVYAFLRNNDGHVLVAGGMQHFILGLDKSRLLPLAQEYGLEFSRILPFVQLYERKMLERQSRQQKSD